tara:strand:- start:575 stop:790 length:216 start_codon:yes stop_codon:yes gene_type:complete
MTTSPANSNDWIDFWENEMPQLSPQREMHIGELDKSIIALSKRKLKLLQEVNDINENISFLRKQQEDLTDV